MIFLSLKNRGVRVQWLWLENRRNKRGRDLNLERSKFFSIFTILFLSFPSFVIFSVIRLLACDTADSQIPNKGVTFFSYQQWASNDSQGSISGRVSGRSSMSKLQHFRLDALPPAKRSEADGPDRCQQPCHSLPWDRTPGHPHMMVTIKVWRIYGQ